MADDIRKRFVLKFEQEGADKVQKQIDKLRESMAGTGMAGMAGGAGASGSGGGANKAQGRLVRQVVGMSRHIHLTTKHLIEFTKALNQAKNALGGGGGGGLGPGTGGQNGAPPGGGPPGGGAGGAGAGGGRSRVSLPPAIANTLRGGLAQALGLGGFFHEGAFQGRRFAGSMLGGIGRRVGGMARGLGSAALATPFMGLQGIAQGLQSIPFGGLVSGPLQVATGTVGSAIGYQRAGLGLGGMANLQGTRGFGRFNRARRRYSDMNRTEALGFAQQLGLSGLDGSFQTAERSGALRESMQARTLGFGAETAGLVQGQRQGGTMGAGVARTIEQAFETGLDRADISHYLQAINQAQQHFLRTGTPINPKSIMDFTKGVTGALHAGGRASQFAQGLQGGLQRISQQGPQSAEEFLALQTFGGFEGGGLAGLLDAQKQLESGEGFSSENLQEFVRRASAGAGGGAAGELAVRRGLFVLGGQVSIDEVRRLISGATGGPMSDEDAAFFDAQASRLRGETNIGKEARTALGRASAVTGARGLEDQRISIGTSLAQSVQKFESNTLTVASSFKELAPTLNMMAEGVGVAAKKLPELAKSLQNAIDTLSTIRPPSWMTWGDDPNPSK